VLDVYDHATKQVDGILQLEPNTVNWSTGDTVEVPHWHLPDVNDTHDSIRMYTPQAQVYGRGYNYSGIVSGDLHGFDLRNVAPLSEYQGYGGWTSAPNTAMYTDGQWQSDFTINQAPVYSLFNIACKADIPGGPAGNGCTHWNAAYSLFSLAGSNGGNFAVNYDPVAYNIGFKPSNTACSSNVGSMVGTVGSVEYGGLGVAGTSASCGVFTPSLVLNNAAAALTGQSGTGANIVTNVAPSISSPLLTTATLTGATTVPIGQSLNIAGSLNITGSCTGCASIQLPGSNGQVITSNGAGGAGAALGTTGSGSVMLSTSPTTTGVLTAQSISSSGTFTQNGVVNINTGSSGAAVNIETGSSGGSVTVGNTTSVFTMYGAVTLPASANLSLAGQSVLSPLGTASATSTSYGSNPLKAQSSVWSPNFGGVGSGGLCQPVASASLVPTSNASTSTLDYQWSVTGRSGCPGLAFSQILQDETAFLDGVKVTHLLSGGAAPVAAAGVAAGGGASVALSNATDLKGILTVVTGASPLASGPLATVSFATPYSAAPVCTVTPANAYAIGVAYSPPATANAFTLNAGGAPLAGGATYIFSFTCME